MKAFAKSFAGVLLLLVCVWIFSASVAYVVRPRVPEYYYNTELSAAEYGILEQLIRHQPGIRSLAADAFDDGKVTKGERDMIEEVAAKARLIATLEEETE